MSLSKAARCQAFISCFFIALFGSTFFQLVQSPPQPSLLPLARMDSQSSDICDTLTPWRSIFAVRRQRWQPTRVVLFTFGWLSIPFVPRTAKTAFAWRHRDVAQPFGLGLFSGPGQMPSSLFPQRHRRRRGRSGRRTRLSRLLRSHWRGRWRRACGQRSGESHSPTSAAPPRRS